MVHGQDADRRQTKEAGFAHHLIKPVDVEQRESVLAGLPEGQAAGKG